MAPTRKNFKKKTFKKNNLMNKNKVKKTKHDFDQDKKIMAIDKKVREFINEAEVKWADEFNENITIGNDGTSALTTYPFVPRPIRGLGPSERIGDVVTMTSWQIKLAFLTGAGLVGPTRVRVIVLIDKEFNGVLVPMTNGGVVGAVSVLDGITVTDITMSPHNHSYVDRFNFLYDKTWIINPNAVGTFTPATGITTSTVQTGSYKSLLFKLRHKIQFDNNVVPSTVANLISWQPVMYIASDQLNDNERPTLNFSGRVYYHDY